MDKVSLIVVNDIKIEVIIPGLLTYGRSGGGEKGYQEERERIHLGVYIQHSVWIGYAA
jgi:hypothetical protein